MVAIARSFRPEAPDYRQGGPMSRMSPAELEKLQPVAGNGLLDRRAFLRGGAALAAAVTGYGTARTASAEALADDPWSRIPGGVTVGYEQRSRFEEKVVRTLSNPNGEPRNMHART